MYGYAADEIVGRNISVLMQSKRPDELPAILQRVAKGERIQHYETERLRKDGTVVDVSVSISPIRERDGAIVGISTVTIDITDRKRAEADLRDLDERLHQAQRLESVGQLAGGIAHDFNNLLAGIMNYSTLAADGLAELTNRHGLGGDQTVVTLGADIAEIAKVANRAARLTRQLLVFSRHGAFKAEVVDLNAIVVDTQNAAAPNHRRDHRSQDGSRRGPALHERRPGTDRTGPHEPGRQRKGCDDQRRDAANRNRNPRTQ